MTDAPSREVEIDPRHAALLIVDVQNYTARRDGGEYCELSAPARDEIVIPKTSSSPFISTSIDYVLRNLGVRSLILAGILTDQCIDSSARRLRFRLSGDDRHRRLRDPQP